MTSTNYLADVQACVDIRNILMDNDEDPVEPTEAPQEYMHSAEVVEGKREEGMLQFIGVYVLKLYGDKAIKVWMKNNKGMTFLDMMRSPCLMLLTVLFL